MSDILLVEELLLRSYAVASFYVTAIC